MTKKILSIIGKTMLGITALALGLSYALNMNFPLIEKSISEKSKTVYEYVKNNEPKKVLYLVSADFEGLVDYDKVNKKVKSDLEVKYQMFKARERSSEEERRKLEEIIENFNLDKGSFLNNLSGLNLFDDGAYGTRPYLVREKQKDCKVYLYRFKSKKDFFDILLDENTNSLDEVIIVAHGKRQLFICDKPDSFIEWLNLPKILGPRNYITTLDIMFMPEKKIKTIRSKLNDNAVVYFLPCEALGNSDNQTTIAEALEYLFQKPVVASSVKNYGWLIDAYPPNNIKISKPEALKGDNVSYKVNFLEGDWFVLYPKDFE